MRRNRRTPWLRRLVGENKLSTDDLIWPVFVVDGENTRQSIAAMPGVERFSVDLLVDAAGAAMDLGIPAICLFPQTRQQVKTPDAREAWNPDNLVCRAVRAIRAAHPDLGIMCDVALDPYNSDGHDGLVRDNQILNDETLEVLSKQALVQAEAGCDILGPSDMMDGRIAAIRSALDEGGFSHTSIISYAAKYASGLYSPFRDAVGSGGVLKGDKKTYQMNPLNSDEAIHEVALDINEGADMVMVKPGLAYLDVLQRVKTTFGVPTCAYHVSGEYAMLQAAAQNGWLDYETVMMESLNCFKRAGADGILSYCALDAARLLKSG
jgi:porphobilinogen synthase